MQDNNFNYYEEDDDIEVTPKKQERPISSAVDSKQVKKKKNPLVTLSVNILSVLFLIFVAISAFSIVSFIWKDTEQQEGNSSYLTFPVMMFAII